MARKVAVIGAGPGGYVAGVRAAQLGAEVTIIEQEDVGGTCLHRGCIPSKVMKTTAELLERFERAREFGIEISGKARVDMKALMGRKSAVIRNQMKGILSLLSHHKIRLLSGTASILRPGLCEAVLSDGERKEVAWDALILAPGSQPLEVAAFPFDGKAVLSSNHALSLEEVPESLLVVGGGVIGCEFAFVFSSLGCRVSVVEALPRVLPITSLDESCSKVIQRELRKRKVECLLNRTVSGVDEAGGRLRVRLRPFAATEGGNGKQEDAEVLDVERMLVAVGRSPHPLVRSPERTWPKVNERGWIVVDERLETSIPGVFAIGDALGPSRPMLAHVASREGSVAAENAMGERRSMDYALVPGVIFTMPEVAHAGLTEADARKQGHPVRADTVLFRSLAKAHVIGEIAGEAKVVSRADTGEILGIHMAGPHAGDLIGEALVAMRSGCSVRDLAGTIHPHPTLSEIMWEVSLKATDHALHG